MADDRVAAAVAELYAGDPTTFTSRRGELAAAARSAGDRAAARAIAALRKPTRTAWVVNRLARTDPAAPAKLAELAAALRAAEQSRHGPRLRELSAARGPLIDALTGQALAAAGVPDPPPALRAEVAATLTAALADPAVFTAFAAGRLTSAAQWAGFGMPEGMDADDKDADGADTGHGDTGHGDTGPESGGVADGGMPGPEAAGAIASVIPIRRRAARRAPARSGRTAAEGSARAPARPGRQEADRRATEEAERRATEEAERLAREAAERAARERARYADAERTVAAASTDAAEAVSAEDRLEAEVRDLEERLTRARDDLAAARLRARRAEAAERRARHVLQLMRPPE